MAFESTNLTNYRSTSVTSLSSETSVDHDGRTNVFTLREPSISPNQTSDDDLPSFDNLSLSGQVQRPTFHKPNFRPLSAVQLLALNKTQPVLSLLQLLFDHVQPSRLVSPNKIHSILS